MDRAVIKENAKAQLGRQIFGNNWMLALVMCLIVSAVESLVSATGFGAIVTVIIGGPLAFSLAYMFLKQTRDGQPMQFEDLLSGFKTDFGGNLLIGLMSAIFIALWSLLLVIPGIVKTYAYSMAYYIKADHPEYDWKQCIDASKELTNGHKGELFVLDLSFIGWYFVGSLCLGVGILWVIPYHEAAKSQFYQALVASSYIPPVADGDAEG